MSRSLETFSIRTRVFAVGDDLPAFAIESLREAELGLEELEGSVLAVTSKIVGLAEGCVVPKGDIDKESLVRREADLFLGEIGYGCFLTVKHGLFIASAGIDESNCASDFYALFPPDPAASAEALRQSLRRHFGLRDFGVLLTDSHTSPLRAGVTGIALAHAGFHGVESRVGRPDLFGRPLAMTRINVADALATAAVYAMGEADEGTPLALVRSPGIVFSNERRPDECRIPPELDLYAPLYAGRLSDSQKT